jgi:hypothetical protein
MLAKSIHQFNRQTREAAGSFTDGERRRWGRRQKRKPFTTENSDTDEKESFGQHKEIKMSDRVFSYITKKHYHTSSY